MVKSLQHIDGETVAEHDTPARVSSWALELAAVGGDETMTRLRERATARAGILAAIGAGAEAQAAAWLYTLTEEMEVDGERIRHRFGASLAELVAGIRRMDVVSTVTERGDRVAATDENFRKMLIAMIDDVRVVLVRLACQLEKLRSARELDADIRLDIGRETLEVFAPLANRLGIWQLKWELEDFAFRYTDPDSYKDLAGRLAERRVDRERYIESFRERLGECLAAAGIVADVAGRPKHIYSIYKKMRSKALRFDDINDVRAVRILVDSIADCYAALGVVHTTWPHIAGEFDDYIATPKENGYRSIHTAVIGPEGKVVEVQIRTREMHDANELGVAAHWRYKENSRQDDATDSKILWLRQLLEWKQEVGEGSEFFERFRNDTAEERIYVFSPKGKVVDLPAGATPLDFAYAIHTDVGHQCRGAKVNGRMVPLNRPLETGVQVEILTQRNGSPSRDWLNPSLGYVNTQKARSRIQRWFKAEDFDHNLAAGRASLERELYRLGAVDVAWDRLASQQGYRRVDDFLAALGSGDLKLSQAVAGLRPQVDRREADQIPASPRSPQRVRGRGLSVQGVGNLLTQFAACCSPLPGDPIVGYITQVRGITVHREDCPNILGMDQSREARIMKIEWGDDSVETFPVDIEITALDRKGLLYDISRVLRDANVNVLSTASQTSEKDNVALMRLRVEMSDVQQLSRVLTQVSQLPNVTDARRVGPG